MAEFHSGVWQAGDLPHDFLQEADGAATEAHAEPEHERQNGRQPGETRPFIHIDRSSGFVIDSDLENER
jgi:hypothetical protein